MKRLFSILLCAVLVASCVKDPTVDPSMPQVCGDGWLDIPFGHSSFDKIDIETRAELPSLIEARVTNMYVMIFSGDTEVTDTNGNVVPANTKIYGHFFDSNNRKDASTELANSDSDCWYVENLDPEKQFDANGNQTNTATYGYTWGRLHMKVPSNQWVKNGYIYIIANLDEGMINVSAGKLGLIRTEEELLDMVAVFNQQSTSRTGLFLMTGFTGIDIENGTFKLGNGDSQGNVYDGTWEDAQIKEGGTSSTLGQVIMLDRVDAKVTVKVGVMPDYITTKQAVRADGKPIFEKDENGNDTTTPVMSSQTIKSFTPTSWQIVNLPKGAWLMPHKEKSSATDTTNPGDAPEAETGGFWNSDINVFEKTESNVAVPDFKNSDGTTVSGKTREEHSFAFYMLENRQSVNKKKTVLGQDATYPDIKPYHLRDKQLKQTSANDEAEVGEYRVYVDQEGNIIEGDQWEFAPENGTYMIVKGEVEMEVKDSDTYAAQTMNAMVTYYIHLGAFGKESANWQHNTAGLDNYDICRNTHYTYTINIKGVRQIEVEVEKDNSDGGWKNTNESQSGNMGDVYLAQETIHTFDAHYGQRVFRFNAEAIKRTADADLLTWYVATPFGRAGVPERVGPSNVEVPTGLDYKWVHFMVNKNNGTISLKEASDEQKKNNIFHVFDTFTESGNSDSYFQYSQQGQWYPGEKAKEQTWAEFAPGDPRTAANQPVLMNVMELCDFLRKQIKLYNEDQDAIKGAQWDNTQKAYIVDGQPYVKKSMFDEPLRDAQGNILSEQRNIDGTTYNVPHYSGGNIYVTAFVDEFYYENNPITGNESPDLWRNFVHSRENQMRMMHILCDASVSADGDSSATGSVVTIRQRPIQTIYESDKELIVAQGGTPINEAWGLEAVDETRQEDVSTKFRFFNYNGAYDTPANSYGGGISTSFVTNNTSPNNGRYNTYIMWGLEGTSGTATTPTEDGVRSWATYLDYERINDYHYNNDQSEFKTYFLNDDPQIANMRYSCMMRNRDNDGDGVIDDDEIRWYIASDNQLVLMFAGSLCLTNEAQLYNSFDRLQTTNFMNHVVSSTRSTQANAGNVPSMIWAEEGCAISRYLEYDNRGVRYSVRCVRNLGTRTNDVSNVSAPGEYSLATEADYPHSPINVEELTGTIDADSEYRIDVSNMSMAGQRKYSVQYEFVPMDENSETAMTYAMFETGEKVSYSGGYQSLYNRANQGLSECEPPYRLPNIKEMAIIYTAIDNSDWWGGSYYYVNSYYSLGNYGNRVYTNKNSDSYSWHVSQNHMTVQGSGSAIRCVKDVTTAGN